MNRSCVNLRWAFVLLLPLMFWHHDQSFVFFDVIEMKQMPCKNVLEACALCGGFLFSLADEVVIFHQMMAV